MKSLFQDITVVPMFTCGVAYTLPDPEYTGWSIEIRHLVLILILSTIIGGWLFSRFGLQKSWSFKIGSLIGVLTTLIAAVFSVTLHFINDCFLRFLYSPTSGFFVGLLIVAACYWGLLLLAQKAFKSAFISVPVSTILLLAAGILLQIYTEVSAPNLTVSIDWLYTTIGFIIGAFIGLVLPTFLKHLKNDSILWLKIPAAFAIVNTIMFAVLTKEHSFNYRTSEASGFPTYVDSEFERLSFLESTPILIVVLIVCTFTLWGLFACILTATDKRIREKQNDPEYLSQFDESAAEEEIKQNS